MVETPGSKRTLLWQRTDSVGLEHCDVTRTSRGWQIIGVAIALLDEAPTHVQYQVQCDNHWRTRTVSLTQWRGEEPQTLSLTRDDSSQWYTGWQPLPQITGCRDIDLGITPATNTLPIRRLALGVGESREVVAAWVRFPDLTVAPLTQRYTRLADRHYRYESPGFATEISVDDWGLALRYEGGWERVEE